MALRTYHVGCPDCMKIMEVELEAGDKRRNGDKFFVVVCQHCGHQWYAKIFETLNVYPFALIKDKM